MRRIMLALLVGAATAIATAACDSNTASPGSNTTTTRTTETVMAPSTARPVSTLPAPPPTSATVDGARTNDHTCSESREWGTGGKDTAPYSIAALYLVRAGQHDCFDRVVLDINGPAEVGYVVGYVPVVTADGSGKPIPVAGKAALQVVVRAPAQGFDDTGHQPGKVLADTGDRFYTSGRLARWRSLREVRFAGFFEGQCTLAVGVSEKLPFRVFTQLDETDKVRRLVIDIAHA
ncbi:hypothetical protein [Actinophytocola sp.]|uniref:AMIN-like domain-containing (lipo)protein n=1 Tax=Actinophytocola sp. TaxID=1872138 RepID=UPI0025B93553|nr:hypothetical protein [Actinophytocola sp.]